MFAGAQNGGKAVIKVWVRIIQVINLLSKKIEVPWDLLETLIEFLKRRGQTDETKYLQKLGYVQSWNGDFTKPRQSVSFSSDARQLEYVPR